MATLDEWTARVSDALGFDATSVDQNLVLDLAREAAHGVARPAAPLATYLVGVAVGRGARASDAAAIVTRLAQTWPNPD